MRALATAAVLALAASPALAQNPAAGGPVVVPSAAVHFPDDRPITLGATRTAADCSASWETAGAEHYLSVVCPTLSGLLLGQDADVDRDAVLGDQLVLGVCSEDGASAGECLTFGHDGTDAVARSGAGDYVIRPAGGLLVHRVSGTQFFLEYSAAGTGANAQVVHEDEENRSNAFTRVSDFGDDQVLYGLSAAVGNQLTVGTLAYDGADHGYDAETDPVTRFQSAADPAAGELGEDEAVRITYVGADDAGYVGTEKGPLRFDPAAAAVRLPRVIAANPSAPHSCAADSDVGATVVSSDTDNNATNDVVCVCLAIGDDGSGSNDAWDWLRLDDNDTDCPDF